jgi:2-hydroxycyclohexanecarboxyl-CoA dehydrogenase
MTRRVAFVTGGGGGIGAEICRELSNAGHKVAVADISGDRALKIAGMMPGASDGAAIGIAVDVTLPDSVTAAVTEVTRTLGPIAICVNCAGWDELRPFLDVDDAFQAKSLDINLEGPIRVTRAVLPSMVEHSYGRIVNIGSDAGRVGSSLESVYSAAKGGIIAFTKTIAREFARYGITANTVCPGPTETPLLQAIVAASADGARTVEAMTKAVPMRRLGRPDDIAPAVAFFASDEARFITGQTLSVSGGLTMA